MILLDYIKSHPNWRQELSEAPYHLAIKDDGPYTIFSYNQIESDFSNPLVQVCRGIILKITDALDRPLAAGKFEQDVKIVCHPFHKFFNYGEPNAHSIDWSSAQVQEKVDGSIIKLWHDMGSWHISTNGMIDAFKTDLQLQTDSIKSFGDLFMDAWKKVTSFDFDYQFAPGYTYIFELVSPYNRVVIPYPESKIYFIGIRKNSTEEELPVVGWDFIAKPKKYSLTFENIFTTAQSLPYDEEGYVVVDKNWNRVKIKSPAYLAVHHLKNNGAVSKDRVLELIKRGEKDEFLAYFPEYKEIFDEVESKYYFTIISIRASVMQAQAYAQDSISRKEFALKVLKHDTKLRSYMFLTYDKNYDVIEERIQDLEYKDLI